MPFYNAFHMRVSLEICRNCGAACCRWPGHVLLTAADITALAQQVGLSETDFIQRHTILAKNRAQLSLMEQASGACCFLNPDNTCRIYAARPQQCREFPHGWRVAGCPAVV